jgi:hypothetical protein
MDGYATNQELPKACYAQTVDSILVDDGGENGVSLKARSCAVSGSLVYMCFCLELCSSENRGQMAALVSTLQIRSIVTADVANRRVEAH